MKKILLTILMGAVILPAFGQYNTQRERSRYSHRGTEQYFGVRLGLNLACINSDDVNMDMDSRSGLAVGGVYGLLLTNSTPLWMEIGALYSEKGGQMHINGYDVKTRLSYLQAPIVIKYSFDVYDDLYLQPYLGGYLAMGIGGKTKNYGTRESYSSYDKLNRFDGGLRVGCGVEYQMIYAELGFDFGLANVSKDDFNTARNQSFFINVGVNF